jgi:hypothetical protein
MATIGFTSAHPDLSIVQCDNESGGINYINNERGETNN